MGKLIDLTGQKFNSLTVIKRSDKKNGSDVCWDCICDCGKKTTVKGIYLRNGHTKSCGCRRIQIGKETGLKNIKDLTGQQFGYLTVIKDSGKRQNKNVVWECICKCGNTCEVITSNLHDGSTKSCGCIKNSYGEQKIIDILNENNISYLKEFCVKELNNARFDFAILNNDNKITRIIEFDGEHHYKEISFHKDNKYSLKDRQQRDKEKNNWAKNHNIPLVRIPYWEKNNITLDMIMGNQYLIDA